MSSQLSRLEWAVCTRDIEHWPAEVLAAADVSPGDSYHDWAVGGLREAMLAAGEAYIARYPDVFDPYLI